MIRYFKNWILQSRYEPLQNVISLSAFPKSGVTYLSFMLFHSFFSDECDIHDLERKYVLDIHTYPRATFSDQGAPRLIKSHFPYDPTISTIHQTSKAIYLIRHPIDVMMSAWDYDHLEKGGVRHTQSPEFRAHVHRWLLSGGVMIPQFGSWVQHVRTWLGQSEIPVHLVTYENLVDNPERELEAIINFIGIQVTAERRRIAINRSSMKSMAALESEEVQKQMDGIFYRNNLATGYSQGHRFINKGHRKSYEAILTSEERLIADNVFGSEIARYFGSQS